MAVTQEVQLKVSNLNMAFGGVQALWEVSLEVKKGEIFSIIVPMVPEKQSFLTASMVCTTPRKGRYFLKEKTSQEKNHTRGPNSVSLGPSKRSNSLRGRRFSIISDWAVISTSRRA